MKTKHILIFVALLVAAYSFNWFNVRNRLINSGTVANPYE